MSVPKTLRGESKLQVFAVSMKLTSHTLQIINNEKVFPKRYRWCITSKIADSAVNILNCINKANSVYVTTDEDYKLRRSYQKQALAETYALMGMIDIAVTTFKLNGNKVEYWSSLLIETQNAIRNWAGKEAKKYGTGKEIKG